MSDRFAPGLAWIDRSRSSPNHGSRPDDTCWPDVIVLHYTGMRDGPSAVDWLCNPAAEVSSHYVVNEDGTILQLVDEARRAWHAGRSFWAGVTDMNSASIGIEIVNGGHDFGLPPFPEPQIDAVIALCRDIASRHSIRPERILAHSDIAPGRKRDPGELFPWQRLAVAGVGHWAVVAPDRVRTAPLLEAMTTRDACSSLTLGDGSVAVSAFQASLARYGYRIAETGIYDAETEIVVRAFQRHFRSGSVDGIADAATQAMLAALHAGLESTGKNENRHRK